MSAHGATSPLGVRRRSAGHCCGGGTPTTPPTRPPPPTSAHLRPQPDGVLLGAGRRWFRTQREGASTLFRMWPYKKLGEEKKPRSPAIRSGSQTSLVLTPGSATSPSPRGVAFLGPSSSRRRSDRSTKPPSRRPGADIPHVPTPRRSCTVDGAHRQPSTGPRSRKLHPASTPQSRFRVDVTKGRPTGNSDRSYALVWVRWHPPCVSLALDCGELANN